MAAGHPTDEDPRQDQLVGGGHRGQGGEGQLELIDAVLGVELFDTDARGSQRGQGVADEALVFEHTGQAVGRPQLIGQLVPRRTDEQELDLVSDRRPQARLRESRFHPGQRAPRAGGHGSAAVVVELPRRPRQTVVDHPQGVEVDADALIADDADLVGEGDPCLVDGEAVPGRAGTESWIGENRRAGRGHHLGQCQSGRIDDRADDRFGVECPEAERRHGPVSFDRAGSASTTVRCRGCATSVPWPATSRTTARDRRAVRRRSARGPAARTRRQRAGRCAQC